MRYSLLTLLRQSLHRHHGWKATWRDAAPKSGYDVIIVSGGGHGLATAYYLAKVHGITNVAVLEQRWIGSGNAGRNTTIIRSNYLLAGNNPFYELSLKMWEGLEQELNYNTMVSQRGVLNLYHSDAQRDAYARRGNLMLMHGVDAELLDTAGVRRMVPFLDFDNTRFPVLGGLLQRRGGTARHDAVGWGYACAVSDLGVDIIRNFEVTGFLREGTAVSDADASAFARSLQQTLDTVAAVSDQSSAAIVMRLSERHLRQTLAKFVPRDLHDRVFQVDSYAQSFRHVLQTAAAEFGLSGPSAH